MSHKYSIADSEESRASPTVNLAADSTRSEKKEHGTLRQQIARRIGGSALVNILGQVLLLISGMFLAWALGKQGYGEYSIIMSIVALVGLPTKAGLPILTVREVAQYRMAGDWGSIRGLLQAAGGFVVVYSVAAAALVAGYIWVTRNSGVEYYWSTLLLPIVAFSGVRSASLRGLKLVVLGQVPEMIIRPLVTIVGLIVWSRLDGTASILEGVWIANLAATASLLVGIWLLWRAVPAEVHRSTPVFHWREWSKSIIPLSIFSGLRIFDAQFSIILVGLLASRGDVGIYRVALSGASLVSIGLGISNGVLAPYYATLIKSGDVKRLERIARRTSDALVLFSLLPALGLCFGGNAILNVTFGSEFRGAWMPMCVLIVGQLVNVAAGSVGLLLNMGGYEVDALRSVMIATIVKFLVMIGLVPWFGLTGAAIGETLSIIVWNVLMSVAVRRRFGIRACGRIVQV